MQNKALVASMNGASKFSKSEGEAQQLGGIIYTKNLKLHQKIPEKIKEGRNIFLLMDKDKDYEDGDMGELCDADFELSNEMASMDMPRDGLAGFTKYFFINEGETTSFFQDCMKEATEVIMARRPHWRPRKAKSVATLLSMFYIVQKEVTDKEVGDSSITEINVEAFESRQAFEDYLMTALDKTDEVERLMADNTAAQPIGLSSLEEEPERTEVAAENSLSPEELMNDIVKDSLLLVEGMNEVDMSKYVKLFHSDSTTVLGIQHPKVKILAKEKNEKMPNFSHQRKKYPDYVSVKPRQFTKINSTSSHGASNTCAGFSTSVALKKLNGENKILVKRIFKLDSEELMASDEEEPMDFDENLSQEYTQYVQSQSGTLKCCSLCDFTS